MKVLKHLFELARSIAATRHGGEELLRPEWECHRGQMVGFNQSDGSLLEIEKRFTEATVFELLLKDFTLGLEKE